MDKRFASGISVEELCRTAPPKPQPCHKCEHKYAGIACPVCKEERPAYTALKNISRRTE